MAIDFTSALYLGLRHPSEALAPWAALSTGRPAVLGEPSEATALAGELAALQGVEGAMLMPSTWHLFWDLMGFLQRRQPVDCLVDDRAYPILQWAAGAAAQRFPHQDRLALQKLAQASRRHGRTPLIVADGYSVSTNRPMPLCDYAEIAAANRGWLIVDDTQALGVLGSAPSAAAPLGTDGGGALRWHGLRDAPLLIGASLAKAFGAPLAVLGGPATILDPFRDASLVRLHCSPPSAAAIAAARRGLAIAQQLGGSLRRRLVQLVTRLRQRLAAAGLRPIGTLPFPVQSFTAASVAATLAAHRQLLRRGVQTVLTAAGQGGPPRLTFIVTAAHRRSDVDRVGRAFGDARLLSGALS